jgi:hypothetical protein
VNRSKTKGMMMANLPTSPVIIQEDPNVAGPGSGMEGGASDSAIGICTDVPNPKESDWARIVIGGTVNPIGKPTSFQSLVEYSIYTFDASPIGFAPADTQAAPGEIYATNAGASGWDLTNKTVEYTTAVGDWLWGAVRGTGPQPTCKVYACDSFIDAMNATFANVWPMSDALGSTSAVASAGGVDLPDVGLPTYEISSMMADACVGVTATQAGGGSGFRNDSSQVPLSLVGSVAGIAANVGGGNFVFTQIGYYNDNWVTLDISFTGNNSVAVVLVGQDFAGSSGGGSRSSTETYNVAVEDEFIILNHTMNIDGTYTIELFVGFVSAGVKAGALPSDGTFDTNATNRYILGTGGTGNLKYQNMAYAPNLISAANIALLSDAWSQNQIGYIDPSPGCS